MVVHCVAKHIESSFCEKWLKLLLRRTIDAYFKIETFNQYIVIKSVGSC